MFKKLKIKFICTIMTLLTSIVVLIFTAVYIGMNKNGEYLLFSQANEVLNNLKVTPNGEIISKGKPGDNSIVILYEAKSNRLTYSNTYGIDEDNIVSIVDDIGKKKEEKGFINNNEESFAYICKRSPVGIEIVLKNATIHKKTMNRLIITSIGIGGVSLILLFLISIIIAKKSIKPVEVAFNSQKRFIADASHELKTPLAVIKTNLELLNSNENSTIKSQKKWFEYITFQTERMSKLVNDLLYLAKADNNEELGSVSKFNMSDAIMNQLLTFEAVLYENNLELSCNIENEIYFIADKEGINQLVGILVDNAIKHSYKDSIVEVSLNKKKEKILFVVTNKGNDIESEDLEKIFERFYRIDKSRNRESGGYGLGLSIAKSIVDKYKGKIFVISGNNRTSFNVEFNRIEE